MLSSTLLATLLLLPAAEPLTVHGVVRDGDGDPLAAAIARPFVRADRWTGEPARWISSPSVTAADGTFAVTVPGDVDEQVVSVAVFSEGFATVCCPVTRRRGIKDGQWSEDAAARQSFTSAFVLHPAVVRTIRCVGSDGRPLSGATLGNAYGTTGNVNRPRAWLSDPPPDVEPSVSDENGLMTIAGLPAGQRLNVHRVEHPQAAGSNLRTNSAANAIGAEPVRMEPMFTITVQTDTVPVRLRMPPEVDRCRLRVAGQLPATGETSATTFSHEACGSVAVGTIRDGLFSLRLPRLSVDSPHGVSIRVRDAVTSRGDPLFAVVEAGASERSLGPNGFQAVAGRTYQVRTWKLATLRGEIVPVDETLPVGGTLLVSVRRPVEEGQPPLDDQVLARKVYPSDRLGRHFELSVPEGEVTLAMVSAEASLATPMRQTVVVPTGGLDLPPWPVRSLPPAIGGRLLRADGQPAGAGVIHWPADKNPPGFLVDPLRPNDGPVIPIRTAPIDTDGRFEFVLRKSFRLNNFAAHDSTDPVAITLQAIIDGETFDVPLPLDDPAHYDDFQFTLPGN